MNKITIDPAESIPAFYAGQSIFLTGATGFLGKVYIEKILRSCPDVCEIFILLRPKNGMTIKERLEKILKLPLYDKLREEQPSNFKKIIPISGNATEVNLGVSNTDRKMLTERVSIVIHASASVKFNDSLKYAIFTNTRSTRDICILAQSIKNLIALVYVSTAYTHIDNPVIGEKVYPPIADWRKMIKAAESMDEHILNIFTAKCLDNFPNTYIFSKNLAESVITDYSSSLPCAIVRPTIVANTLDDPFPGWIDNYYGPIGLLVSVGKGVIRVCQSNKYVCLDTVPVDVVIKCIIIATWHIGLPTFTSNGPFILNCSASRDKVLSIERITKMGFELIKEIPFETTLWTPNIIHIESPTIYYILTILLHMLPALLIDLILKLAGHRPMLTRLQRKVFVANRALKHFMCYQWQFEFKNYPKFYTLVPPKDRKTFSLCNPFDVDVAACYRNSLIGVKLYLLKEDMNRLDAARTNHRRLDLFVTTLKTIIIIGLLWMMYQWI